jgi:hypothetical protein
LFRLWTISKRPRNAIVNGHCEAALPGERLAHLPVLYLSRPTPLKSRRHNA